MHTYIQTHAHRTHNSKCTYVHVQHAHSTHNSKYTYVYNMRTVHTTANIHTCTTCAQYTQQQMYIHVQHAHSTHNSKCTYGTFHKKLDDVRRSDRCTYGVRTVTVRGTSAVRPFVVRLRPPSFVSKNPFKSRNIIIHWHHRYILYNILKIMSTLLF